MDIHVDIHDQEMMERAVADHTHIQWTEATFNPITGCTKTSDGCTNCYIDRTPPFRMNRRRFNGNHIGATTGVQLHPERLDQPTHWRKPRRIFVCSLADLFQAEVPDDFIADVFTTIARGPQHTWQVLTKRHARMRSLMSSVQFANAIFDRLDSSTRVVSGPVVGFPNVELGVSVENQQWADIRVPALIDAGPGRWKRWLSCEPLLGPVDLTSWLPDLAWVVIGGESGPGARPMDLDWARSLVTQCRDAKVPVFVKQLGTEWACDTYIGGQPIARTDPKGGNWDHWPTNLRVREYPTVTEAVTR